MRREFVLITGLALSLSSSAFAPNNSQRRRRNLFVQQQEEETSPAAGVSSSRFHHNRKSPSRRGFRFALSESNFNAPDDTSASTTTPTSQKLQELQALETELKNYLAYISMPSDDSSLNTITPVPRPPSIPPPLAKLFSSSPNDSQDKDPEQVLQELRQSVQQEEQRIRQAQEELRELQQQEETLRKAEAALQKSRELAAQRRQKLLQQTQRATQSLESTRQQVEELSKAEAEEAEEEQSSSAAGDKEAISRSRSTVSLDDLASSSSNDVPSFIKSKSFLDAISSPKASASSSKRSTALNIPTLSDWVQYDDGSISGTIQGSAHFEDGKTISTSPLVSTSVVQGGRVVETTSGTRYYLEESSVSSNPAPPSLDPPSQQETVATASRSTVNLESILSSDPNQAQPDDSSTQQPQEEEKQQERADFDASRLETWDRYISQGIPVLYDWSFLSDTKSLSGKIRGSRNFPDNAIVGTSALTTSFPFAGTIASTESGSRYYLDLAATDSTNSAGQTTTKNEQEQRLPEIRNWTQRDDGSIAGQVYNSKTGAANGDFIVTSPIVNQGDVTEGGIVETASGSRYYLSGPSSEQPKEETQRLASSSPAPASPTITIPKLFSSTPTNPTTPAATPRKTFSLSDLGFGFFGRGNLSKKLYDMEQRAPEGVPTLLDWTINPQDQTLTGTVAGSSTMTDGSRITTSPILMAVTADGGVQQYQVVETTSGSKYFLG